MVDITIKPRAGKQSKRFPITVSLSGDPTVAQLKEAIAKKSNLNYHRQRLTTADKKALDNDDQTLKQAGLSNGDSLEIKDLGPQISWRTVFLTEYFGPLFIHPLFFYGQKLIYRQEFEHSQMQKIALVLVLLHYVKRELETLFVHRFSSATMPWTNIIKNSTHYWGLSGLVLAAPLYAPRYGATRVAGTILANNQYLFGCLGAWLFGEIGFGFDLVSCPNYLFETVSWVAFTALTLNPAAALFSAISVGQMYVWAIKKHKRYRKEFGNEYPKKRKALFPFIV